MPYQAHICRSSTPTKKIMQSTKLLLRFSLYYSILFTNQTGGNHMSYETRAAEFVVRCHKHETIDVRRRDYGHSK